MTSILHHTSKLRKVHNTVLVFIAVQGVRLLYRNRIPANSSGTGPGYHGKSLYVITFLNICKNCSDLHSTAQVGFEATTVLCSRGTFNRLQITDPQNALAWR